MSVYQVNRFLLTEVRAKTRKEVPLHPRWSSRESLINQCCPL